MIIAGNHRILNKLIAGLLLSVLLLLSSVSFAQENDDLLDVLAYNSSRSTRPPVPEGDFQSIVIPIKRVQNLMMVEATIDGQEGNFILDTGAPHLVLNKTYFRRGKLSDGTSAAGITGAGSTVYHLLIDSLVISGLSYHNVDADLVNLGHLEDSKGVQIFGLLGANLFNELEMEIDIRSNTLTLHRLDKDGNRRSGSGNISSVPDLKLPLEVMNNIIFINGAVAGKKLRFCLDTGAETNVLSNASGNKVLEQFELQSRAALAGSGVQKLDVLSGRLKELTLGAGKFSNVPFILTSLAQLQQVYGISLDGIVGYDFLSRGLVSINIEKKELTMYYYKGEE
ncbi:MAG: aspartyl protease family protein [Chitinophagales bacterium]|nr:aspartyl protease family protein [Bacteroidota bacterium]MBX7140894.1 aspartyl protease family protein [Chitinophagales bacterium]